MSNSVTKTLTVELNSGKSFEIDVEADGEYDRNYGADADGNRGEATWFLAGWSWPIPDKDSDGNLLTDEEKNELELKLNEKVDKEDWEFSNEPDVEYEPELEDR